MIRRRLSHLVLLLCLSSASLVRGQTEDQLAQERRSYPAVDDAVTPYATNGPICCPIFLIASYRDRLLAANGNALWTSGNGIDWNLLNRQPPDMLTSTDDNLYLNVVGSGLMEAPNGPDYHAIHPPPGARVTSIAKGEGALYAANGSPRIFVTSDTPQTWKALPTIAPGSDIKRIAIAGGVLFALAESSGLVYRSSTPGKSWATGGQLPSDAGKIHQLTTLGDDVYAVAERGLYRPERSGGAWKLAMAAPTATSLFGVADFQGKRYAATDRGMFVLENAEWRLVNSTMSRGAVHRLSHINSTVFASTSNGLYESGDLGRSWTPSSPPLDRGVVVNGVCRVGDRQFAATEHGLYTRAGFKTPWDLVSVAGRSVPLSAIAATDSGNVVIATKGDPANHSGSVLYLADHGANSFVKLPDLPGQRIVTRLAVIDERIFALTDRGAPQLSEDRHTWMLEDVLDDKLVYKIVPRGNDVLAALTPANMFFRSNSGNTWTPSPQILVSGLDAWFDPQDSNVVIAASGNGLLWSTNVDDSSGQFKRWNPDRMAFAAGIVLDIVPSSPSNQRTILLGTDYGVYQLDDKLHTSGWLSARWRQGKQFWDRHYHEPWFWLVTTGISALSAYSIALFALLLLAYGGIGGWVGADWLMSAVSKPMEMAPVLLRWALFLGYRRRLALLPDIQLAAERYFGLSARLPDGSTTLPDEDGNALHQALTLLLDQHKCIVVIGEGGAGKSTLLSRWVWLASQGQLPGELAKFVPVYVTADMYEGDLVQAITDTLKQRDGLPLDRKGDIVRQQIQAGRILVLFDGVSEVDGDKVRALNRMITIALDNQMQRSRFIFCSRPLKKLPTIVPVVTLQPLDIETIRTRYLPLRSDLDEQRKEQVLRQLLSFGSPTVEPLLLSLAVADSLDETIAVNRADLFAHYFRRLLKVESEGQQVTWEGWRSILETLAEWFMLTTGRRGLGLPHRALVRLMLERSDGAPLREQIHAEYGLSFDSELALLESLASAGILRRGLRWSFRHDTFEEYFAACRIITGIEEDDPVDLDLWNGAQEKEFVRVVQFIKDLASDELRARILSSPTGNLAVNWRAILQA